MKNNLLIIFILLITGCSKQLPECSSVEILDMIRSSYHKHNGSNNELIDFKLEMTTTISTDKETGSKKCITNATASYKKPVIDWLNEKDRRDWLNAIEFIVLNAIYSEMNDVKKTEVQYSIFRDEQNNSYFIKYHNNWIEGDLDLGFKYIQDKYKKSNSENKKSEN